MSWHFDALPYCLAVGTILLGAFEIYKNWHEYKKAWLKISVAVVFILVGAGSLISLHHENADKKEAAEKAGKDMRVLQDSVVKLQGEVEQSERARGRDTKTYLASVGELKAEVKTELLRKKLAAVETQLLKTQKAMAPGPKAELVFTFVPFPEPPAPAMPTPVREVTLPLKSDGTLHADLAILNLTDVDAIGNAIDLKICDECRYAKEPENTAKLPGLDETWRLIKADSIHAKEAGGPRLAVFETWGLGKYSCIASAPAGGPNIGAPHLSRTLR